MSFWQTYSNPASSSPLTSSDVLTTLAVELKKARARDKTTHKETGKILPVHISDFVLRIGKLSAPKARAVFAGKQLALRVQVALPLLLFY